MSLPDLAAACRTSGLPVVEIPGWQTRGRPASTGGFSPRGIVVHHTGDNGQVPPLRYASTTLANGFSSLPGPLCQVGLGRDGTVYVVAAGRANHAGSVRSVGFMAAGDGNSQALGIEAMNSGGEGWSAVQLDAYHRLCAALCDHYGWPRSHVVAHAECSTAGKWDPGYQGRVIDMGAFRQGVATAHLGDDMALTDVINDPDGIPDGARTSGTLADRIAWTDYRLRVLSDALLAPAPDPDGIAARPTDRLPWIDSRVRELTAQVAGLTEAVKALAVGTGADPSAITAAAEEGTRRALAATYRAAAEEAGQ